jgi:hypothetical protein
MMQMIEQTAAIQSTEEILGKDVTQQNRTK